MNPATDPLKPSFISPKWSLPNQLNYVEQIQVITTHPFFTGKCPECKSKLALVLRRPGQSSCSACGWSDQDHD